MQQPPMPGSPYGVPPAGGPPTGAARDALSGPAIGLIVTGALGIVFSLFSMVNGLLHRGEPLPAETPEQMRAFLEATQRGGPLFNLVPLALSAFVIFGALKMKNVQRFGIAMAAAIVAMIPCLSPCCCIGLPIGIWALVVMNKPEVKSAFTP